MDKRKRSGLEITSIGSLYQGPWEKKYWSSSRGKDRYPYPVGYCAVRCHNGNSYQMEIQEGSRGPIFVVTFGDGIVCSADTPTIAWQNVMKKETSNSKKPQRRLVNVNGPELFGFLNPLVQRLFRELVSSQEKAHPSDEALESWESECYRGNADDQTLSAHDESNKSTLWESVKTVTVRKSRTSIVSASGLCKRKDLTSKIPNASGPSEQMQLTDLEKLCSKSDKKRLKLTKPTNKMTEDFHHIGDDVVAPDSSDGESDPEMEDDTIMFSLKKVYRNRCSSEGRSSKHSHDQSNFESHNRFLDKPIPLMLNFSEVGDKPSEVHVVQRLASTPFNQNHVTSNISEDLNANEPATIPNVERSKFQDGLEVITSSDEDKQSNIKPRESFVHMTPPIVENNEVSEVAEHQRERYTFLICKENHESTDNSVYYHHFNTKSLGTVVPDSLDDFPSQIPMETMQGMGICMGQFSTPVHQKSKTVTKHTVSPTIEIPDSVEESQLCIAGDKEALLTSTTQNMNEDLLMEHDHVVENSVVPDSYDTDNAVLCSEDASKQETGNMVVEETLPAEKRQTNSVDSEPEFLSIENSQCSESNMHMGESDSLGQDLTKSMITLLLPQALDLLDNKGHVQYKRRNRMKANKGTFKKRTKDGSSTTKVSELNSEEIAISLDNQTTNSESILNLREPSMEADQKCLATDFFVNQEDINNSLVLGKPNTRAENLLESDALHATSSSSELEKDMDKRRGCINHDVSVDFWTMKPLADMHANNSDYKIEEQDKSEVDYKSVAKGDMGDHDEVTAVNDGLPDLHAYNHKQSSCEMDANVSIGTMERVPLNVLQSDFLEPKACLEHLMSVLVLKVHFQEDKLRFVVLCGMQNSKSRVLYIYDTPTTGFDLTLLSSINMDVTACACHTAHLELETCGVQITPDGCYLVLLDMFKPRNTVIEPTKEQVSCCLGIKLFSYSNGDFSVHNTLMSSGKHILSFLVTETNMVISGGETGYVCCWVMDSSWRICLEKFTLPAPVNEEDQLTNIIQLLAVPSWPFLLVGCDDQSSIAIWNVSARQLLRIAKLSGSVPQEVHFLNISNHDTTEQMLESGEVVMSNFTLLFLVGSGQQMTHQNILKSWKLEALRRDGNISVVDLDDLLERVSAMSIMEGIGVAGTADGLFHLWDTVSGLVFKTYTELQGVGITHIASNWGGNVLAVAGNDGRVFIYMKP